jgi:quinol monooxygenase YgiN
MVTVLTQLIAKDSNACNALERIFQQLVNETPSEQGCISYEIHQESNQLLSYIIIEKWASQEYLDNHIKMIDAKGYATQAVSLLAKQVESIILQSLHNN